MAAIFHIIFSILSMAKTKYDSAILILICIKALNDYSCLTCATITHTIATINAIASLVSDLLYIFAG